MGASADDPGVRREKLVCALEDLEAVLNALPVDDPRRRAAVAAAIAFVETALHREPPPIRAVPRETPEP